MKNDPRLIDAIDAITNEVLDFSAENNLPWVCSDCGMYFCEGMPNECAYDDVGCNKILKETKTSWKTQ